VLEVFPTGGMLWHYRYRLNGKAERVTLGRYPALSLKQARIERDKRETMVALGRSPATQKRLAKIAARFFREVAAKERKNPTDLHRYFEKSIQPAIGSKRVRDVTTDDVRTIIWREKKRRLRRCRRCHPRPAQKNVRLCRHHRPRRLEPRARPADAPRAQGPLAGPRPVTG
jgi:hypothetical protein